jgi:hypothetical protein
MKTFAWRILLVRVRSPWAQWVAGRRTRGIDRHHAYVGFDDVRTRPREIADVDAGRGRIGHRDLDGRIPHDDVAGNDVTLGTGDERDAVGIPDNGIADDDVVVCTRRDEPYPEVIALRRVAVSNEPVRTEPVAS